MHSCVIVLSFAPLRFMSAGPSVSHNLSLSHTLTVSCHACLCILTDAVRCCGLCHLFRAPVSVGLFRWNGSACDDASRKADETFSAKRRRPHGTRTRYCFDSQYAMTTNRSLHWRRARHRATQLVARGLMSHLITQSPLYASCGLLKAFGATAAF